MRSVAALLVVLAFAATANAQQVSDRALTRALSGGPGDVPGLVQGLVQIQDRFQVSPAQLSRCIAAAGLRNDPFLDGLLANAEGVSVNRGKVSIRFSQETHLPMKDTDGSVLGWLHVDDTVSLEVEDGGRTLSTIRGLSASKSKNGIRGEILGLKIGPTTVTVRAGKWSMVLFSKTFVVSQPSSSTGMSGAVNRN